MAPESFGVPRHAARVHTTVHEKGDCPPLGGRKRDCPPQNRGISIFSPPFSADWCAQMPTIVQFTDVSASGIAA